MARKKNNSKALWIVLAILTVLVIIILVMKKKPAADASPAAPEKTENVVSGAESAPALGRTGWLEMPGRTMTTDEGMHCSTHFAMMDGREQRNYTFLYDEDEMTSYWVAYPLCQSHMGSGRVESWAYDPDVESASQTSVASGYGAAYATKFYKKNHYARGHQMPNADRNNVPEMMAQTYYSTNMTPQVQNGFNGAIWKTLEEAVRAAVGTDTLYLVTGASFNKTGEQLPVATITNKNDRKELPVPNYYWKVLLKVRRAADGSLQDARSIGFWLPHEELKGHSFTEYAVPVDQIEEWTGFDFFVNLPDPLENQAEIQQDWNSFQTW